MSVGPELSIMYHHNNQQYYNSTPLLISQHQQYRIQQEQGQNHQQKRPLYDQMINDQHSKQQHNKHQQHSFSPPLSIASSSSTTNSSSSGSFYSNLSSSPPSAAFNIHASSSSTSTNMRIKKKLPSTLNTIYSSQNTSNIVQQSQPTKPTAATVWNFTWLVFMNEKWVPFDILNQTKLEQTLTVGGTFVDINDSHFPDVKRVRVFPRSNYLSYLGVKYRLSRIMQPDAYLDHVGVAEAKKPTLPLQTASLPTADEDGDSRTRRAWEM